MGSVEPKKQHKPCKVFTEETLDDIGHRLEQSPSKSLTSISQQVGISYDYVQKCMDNECGQFQHLRNEVGKYDNL